MLNCSGDPLENYLKPFGFSVVLLPREGIHPLQLATMKASRRLEGIGELARIFSANSEPVPAITSDTALNLAGARSGQLNVGVGLKLLAGACSALRIPPLGLSGGFSNASKISFEFDDVSVESAAFSDLDRFLADADLIGNSPSVKAMLEADSIYAVLAVLRARKIIINAEDSKGREAAIDVPSIQGVIGANASVKTASAKSSRMELTSPVALAFGVKAVQLFFEQGALTTMRPTNAGEVMLEANTLRAAAAEPVPLDPDAVF